MGTISKFKIEAPSDREIVMTRVFDAPRQMLFDAFTKPELVPQWLTGCVGHTMPICEIDLRVGGAYRYVWRGPDGFEMSSQGLFREIVAPERVVATERFEPAWYKGENINTTTFVEADGMTTVTLKIECASRQVRDEMLKSGMDRGVAYSYDQLEKMLGEQMREKAS
ncbi:MAG TPA: SRPBCC family protein [Verrucomicrobiae bacterium]|jgi:uncharacterized protein YndB with AHSA1/START domain|nr:SRPBCC family protein [Verrucomicrobiae bacterium]